MSCNMLLIGVIRLRNEREMETDVTFLLTKFGVAMHASKLDLGLCRYKMKEYMRTTAFTGTTGRYNTSRIGLLMMKEINFIRPFNNQGGFTGISLNLPQNKKFENIWAKIMASTKVASLTSDGGRFTVTKEAAQEISQVKSGVVVSNVRGTLAMFARLKNGLAVTQAVEVRDR